jgi:hypothetical protein
MTNLWTNRADRIIVLALVAALAAPVRAQSDALKITVVEGRDAQHDLTARQSAATSVEVRQDGRAVEGARVRFALPAFGPSGRFADGMRDYAGYTGEDGRARMPAFTPNGIEGRFTVVVEAAYGGGTASVAIPQSNLARVHRLALVNEGSAAGKSRAGSKLLLVLGIVGAAAAGAAFASRGKSGPPTSVSIGGIGVGGGN